MSMEERAREYLVDSRGEGGLVCELDRSPMVDLPTLIIGMGGTGIDAMLHAKYVIQRKIVAPDGMRRPGRLAFLAVDTDENAFKEKHVGDVRVEESEKVLINEPNLASYMRNPSLIPQSYMKDWLCRGINADAITYGAGGIRQCGRFMLIDRAQEFIDKLTNAANRAWGAGKENGAAFGPDTKFNVYLLSGVSGGTGSGTFLDAAYLTREILLHHVNKPVQMRGIIFMPDVNLCKVTNAATRAFIPVNGYAALRELDFWMNTNRGRNFRQQYTPMVSVDTPDAPFDLCFFVSPNGALPGDYDRCMQTTGEALMNVLTAPEENAQNKAMDFESYVTNLQQMVIGAQLKTTYSGNYIYASLGMDEQRLQLDSMANYLAYYLLLKVQGLFDREPTKEEVEAFFSKEMRLDSKRGLQRLFDRAIPARPFNAPVRTLDDFKNAVKGYKKAEVLDDDLLASELQAWVNQCRSTYNQNLNAMVEECMTAIQRDLEEKFVSLQFGPYYAHRMLHNTKVGQPDVLKRLEEEKNAVFSFLSTADDRAENLKSLAEKALKSARNNRHVPLMAGPKYNDYVDAVFRYYDHLRYTAFAAVAVQFYTRMLDSTTDYNNLIVERFSNLLEHLTEVFKSNSDIITNVNQDGQTHTWNVGNFDQIRGSVDQALENLRTAGQEDALVKEFLETMLRDRNAWVGDEGGLGESFSHFVAEKFGNLMQMSMEATYKQMEGLTSDPQLIAHIQNTVLPRLQSGAKVLYTPDPRLSPLQNCPGRAMIAVPSMATNIRTAVDQYVQARNIDCDVVVSKRQGSLFWFQASFGLPLYAHDALRTYQTAHDVYGANDHHLGRYLKMSAEENWLTLLPPLMPEATWAYANYENPTWAARNAETRKMFNEACDSGLVLPLEADSPVRVLGRVDKAAYDALLAKAPMTPEQQKQVAEGGAAVAANLHLDGAAVQSFVDAAEAFANAGWKPSPEEKFKFDAFNLLMNGQQVANQNADPELRMRQIIGENLLWTPDLAGKLQQQLELKRALQEVIRVHRVYLDLGQTAKREQQSFADALTYGLYRMMAARVFQLDGAEEGVPPFILMTIQDYRLAPVTDPYYALFRKYQTLTDEQKSTMARICAVREKRMNEEINRLDSTRYQRYCKTVRGIDDAIKRRLDAINMDVTFEHPQIRQFYVNLHQIFELFLAGGMD